ncbi:MAG: GAF domain-containing protein [Anaerolineae bacterium]|nr:GAF domain-containing protein [Anaerolineae bacterium]
MRAFLAKIYRLDKYPTPVARERALLVYALCTLFLIGMVGFTAIDIFLLQPSFLLGGGGESVFASYALLILIVLGMVGIVGTRQGIRLAYYAPIVLTLLMAVGGLGAGYTGSVVLFAIFILTTALNLSERATFVSWGISAAIMFLYVNLVPVPEDTTPTLTVVGAWLGVISLGVVVLLSVFFRRLLRSVEFSYLLSGVRSQLRIATITTDIASRITHQASLNDVLNSAIQLITESYPSIYHAQVFLVDLETSAANLSASTGEAGLQLLARKHSLMVGSQSVIGQVTSSGEPVVTRAGELVHRPNVILPDTAAEAAFPLKLGDTVIGALDLQSREADAFLPQEVPIFQSLADTLAVVIDNARLADQTGIRLLENQQLLEETRASAREVERLNRQLTRGAWSQTLSARRDVYDLTMDFESGEMTQGASALTPALKIAASENRVVDEVANDDSARVIAVPVRVRGEVIGAIEFELAQADEITPEEIALIQSASEQLGLALDTVRLSEQTQAQAARERKAGEIAGQLLMANDIDALLERAASSFNEALGAVYTRVSIRPHIESSHAPASDGSYASANGSTNGHLMASDADE